MAGEREACTEPSADGVVSLRDLLARQDDAALSFLRELHGSSDCHLKAMEGHELTQSTRSALTTLLTSLEASEGYDSLNEVAEVVVLDLSGVLRATPNPSKWVEETLEDACRRIHRGVSAVIALLESISGIPRTRHYDRDLDTQIALETRRAYSRFASTIDSLRQSCPDPSIFLMEASHVIDELLNQHGGSVRFSDRDILLELLSRATSSFELDHRDRLRLEQDITSTASLLGGVNERAELVEHDIALVQRGLEALDAEVPVTEVMKQLSDLEGLSPGFDALLNGFEDLSVDPLELRLILGTLSDGLEMLSASS